MMQVTVKQQNLSSFMVVTGGMKKHTSATKLVGFGIVEQGLCLEDAMRIASEKSRKNRNKITYSVVTRRDQLVARFEKGRVVAYNMVAVA